MSGAIHWPPSTAVAGVMGWPISHSRSPRLHGHWLNRYGIAGSYVPLAVSPDCVEAALEGIRALGFRGCNITVPHKEAALKVLDVLDPVAERIGAVNTVVVGPDRRLEGTNTDAFGFLENLRAGCDHWIPSRPAVLLGAGGAARAVAVALMDAGCRDIRIANRARARADALEVALGPAITAVDWDDRVGATEGAGLLVNCTTLGMAGHHALEMDVSRLPDDAVVTDIVYTPLITPLLADAAVRGLAIVDGIGMLLHQARPGFRAWFGVDPVVDGDLRAAVLGDEAR
ncbi:MAG: shikimate dehydrogenase [Rhodospirillaceae bacterium]|nr:shikimate dehydrogenase [Rhodospirillaceae bacterium]